jgi:hypothetical protein
MYVVCTTLITDCKYFDVQHLSAFVIGTDSSLCGWKCTVWTKIETHDAVSCLRLVVTGSALTRFRSECSPFGIYDETN